MRGRSCELGDQGARSEYKFKNVQCTRQIPFPFCVTSRQKDRGVRQKNKDHAVRLTGKFRRERSHRNFL